MSESLMRALGARRLFRAALARVHELQEHPGAATDDCAACVGYVRELVGRKKAAGEASNEGLRQ